MLKLKRYKDNPIIEPTTNWWECKQVFNSAIIVKNNKIHLWYRAIGSAPVSSIGYARLTDPVTVEFRNTEPVLVGGSRDEFERLGVEDPRVVEIEGRLYMTYTATSLMTEFDAQPPAWSHSGTPWRIRIELTTIENFMNFDKKGIILPETDSKNAALFPQKINGNYWLLHRIFPNIWISQTETLTRFPKGAILAQPRRNSWDSDRIGAGAPPIKTPLGWLEFYHGF